MSGFAGTGSNFEEEADRVGKEPHVIWDFSYPNDITQEPLPEYGDVSPMKWYWEFSHYREELGQNS